MIGITTGYEAKAEDREKNWQISEMAFLTANTTFSNLHI